MAKKNDAARAFQPLSVAVLGLGNWGTALAQHLACMGHEVTAWDREEKICAGISQNRRNPLYQSAIELSERVTIADSFEQLFEAKIFVLVVPSVALSEVVPTLKLGPETILVSAIKGFEQKTLQTPLQFCENHLQSKPKLSVLSGPSFAVDVVQGRPCGVVGASKDESVAQTVAEAFSNESMKVYISTDPLGVELGGILKNSIALAVGICDGLELGDSARAGIVTRGLAEIMNLAVKMGARRETLFGLSGLGDLLMTATCDTSRNRTVGLRLGRGESLEAIIETLGSVAEGVKTTPRILSLAEKHRVEMPIVESTQKVLSGEIHAKDLVSRLITRPLRKEFDPA